MSSVLPPAVTSPRRPPVIRYIAIVWVLIVGFSAARVISNHAVAASVHLAVGGLGLAGLWIAGRRLDAFWRARLAAEEAQRTAERRWQVALDSTGDGLWEWNAATDEAYYSPRWKAMLGYADHEFPNSSAAWLALVHPDDRAGLDARMRAHTEGTASHYESEHRLRCKDGTYRWVLARGRVTDRAPDGRALRAVGTHTDITTRRHTELVLRASELRYRQLVENGVFPATIASFATGRLLFVNRRAAEFLGLRQGSSAGRPAADFWVNSAERARMVGEVLAGGDVVQREVAMKTARGELVAVEMSGHRIDFEGEPAMFTVFRDISERKRAEAALHQSHELLGKLAAQVPGVIYQYRWWTDGRSAFPFASPGMNDIYELTPEEVREDATPVFGRLHPEDREQVTNDILASAQNLTAFHCEFRVVLPRQGLRWRLSDAMPERTPDGGTLWYGIISDITERKHAEEALRRNERQLALAMDLARAGSWELNAAATVFTFTDPLFALLGTTAEREGGYRVTTEKCAREFMLPEESGLISTQAAGIRATTDPKAKWRLEHRVRRRDGAVRNVTVDIMMVTDEAGRIVGSRGVNQDTTERKEAEAALKARERELDLFFSQSLDGFFFMMLDEPIRWRDAADREAVLDYVFKHQRVTRANDALLGQYGATREQFLGRTPAELTAHDLEAGREGWRQLFDAGRLHVETHARKLNGTPIWIEGDYICLYDAEERITGHFGVQRDITQRKHAEAELVRSQTRLARAMELGRMGAWDFDLATTCFTFSDQLFALYGTTAAREGGYAMPVEKYAREFLPGEDIGVIAAQAEKMRLANSAGAEWQLEHRIRRRDGAIRHMHVRITVITDAAGRVVGARGVNTDITERIQSEAERRKLSRAVEQSPVTVVITDTAGTIEYANPQFTKVTGYTLAEVVGKNPRMLKSGVQSDAVYRDLWTTIASGREWRGELCNRRKDETLYWEDASISPVFDEQGRITHYLAVKEDITERRESLARMREQAALLDVARDAIMVVDLAGIVRFWNRGAELIYGWSVAEAVGRNLFALVYDEAHPAPLLAREAVLKVGEWTGELKQRSKSGATILSRGRSVLMRNPAGDPRSILLTASDITEAKRLEAIFLRAQRLESVGSLASGVAHDLNNVLAPIMLSIELLRPLAVTPEDREALQLMGDATRRGADVVRQLLLFGRGSDAPSETMEVGKVLNEMLRMMRETFPRNLTIGGGAPRDLWPVCGHSTQIYQVVLNLCVNARDAMPSGGQLTLAARNLHADEAFVRKNPGLQAGRYIEIMVRDTGTGIPAAIIDRIFDPFFTTKELGKGTGLGLSTVVGIAKSHGGLVTVNSQEGAGSEFCVYLPAVEASPRRRVPVEHVALPKGRGELVLLVDDESSIRQIVGRALEELGYRTLIASNGGEGLTLARQHLGELRIVVLDMMMPGIDGVQVVRELREFAPALPIIACSGLDRYRGELKALGLDRLHFLHKPFAVEELYSALRAGLDGSADAAAAPPA